MNAKNVRILKADASKLDGFLGYFDVVTALDVLEHLNDISAVTLSIYKILKNGGIFVMSTPNWYDKIRRMIYRDGLHKHAYSSIGWKRVIAKSGFLPLEVRTVNFPILNSDFLCRKAHLFGECVVNIFRKP
jgi:SAM-dependent methyltransferase